MLLVSALTAWRDEAAAAAAVPCEWTMFGAMALCMYIARHQESRTSLPGYRFTVVTCVHQELSGVQPTRLQQHKSSDPRR